MPSPGSVGILWHSLLALPGPSWVAVVLFTSIASLQVKDLLRVCSRSLCVHPHQVSSLHSHPTRFHSVSVIILLVTGAVLSPAVLWGILGEWGGTGEETAALGDWGAGRLVMALRGHLSSPRCYVGRMETVGEFRQMPGPGAVFVESEQAICNFRERDMLILLLRVLSTKTSYLYFNLS